MTFNVVESTFNRWLRQLTNLGYYVTEKEDKEHDYKKIYTVQNLFDLKEAIVGVFFKGTYSVYVYVPVSEEEYDECEFKCLEFPVIKSNHTVRDIIYTEDTLKRMAENHDCLRYDPASRTLFLTARGKQRESLSEQKQYEKRKELFGAIKSYIAAKVGTQDTLAEDMATEFVNSIDESISELGDW
ncbi:MAG: hypothetical protein DWQ19_12145 [Crenarchaeota archaeon]|nr:MAG: hypothetical protein DWQ19_12145 [Thermoproteota archaeon]